MSEQYYWVQKVGDHHWAVIDDERHTVVATWSTQQEALADVQRLLKNRIKLLKDQRQEQPDPPLDLPLEQRGFGV